jgi:ATP/maltotriose-dependent transcriptional regulator MalT
VLPFALTFLATAHLWSGRPSVAEAEAEEARRLAHEAAQDNLALQVDTVLAGVAALRGREATCRALAERARAVARERGLVLVEGAATMALAELELALGTPDAAYERLDRLAHRPGAHMAHRFAVVPTLVEAAARAGRAAEARAAAEGFSEWARMTGSSWALPLAARSLALVATDHAEGDRLLAEAMALHHRHRRALDLARTELVSGERLRRARRKAEARGPLRAALEAFEAAGAVPWAERARDELRAAGESAPPRGGRPLDRLTPQELQVARLVARGASNRDAAAALFLSPRTVEYHLHKVFRKLGVHARAELAAALAGSETG